MISCPYKLLMAIERVHRFEEDRKPFEKLASKNASYTF